MHLFVIHDNYYFISKYIVAGQGSGLCAIVHELCKLSKRTLAIDGQPRLLKCSGCLADVSREIGAFEE